MTDSPASDFPHIFWRRLKRTDQRGKATRPAVPPQPPLRPNAAGHRQQIARQASEAVDKLIEQRQTIGVKPQHLLVLEMEFVQAAQRDWLEKMGAKILDEGERRVPLDDPVYCVPLAFDTAAHRQAFESLRSLPGHGISRVRRDRGTHGAPHELRVTACFEKLDEAKAFWKNAALHAKHYFQVGKTPPKKEATEVRHAWVVEFPDLATVESFRGQRVAGGQSASGLGALAPAERANLLDAIDTIRVLEPADRTGRRLQAEGVPDSDEFAIDVDLWHPGDARQVGAEIKAFRDLVARHGGRVTDGPTPVAGTFFIARVKGNTATLDAVLSYDRVAFADLPPQLPPMPATVFKPIQLPDGGIPPPADNAPLACLVDSGVLASHPLLTGWVHDERDFDSGELTEVDQVGHGTHLAGIVVYGDVYRCIQKQSWEPKVRVLSAKVMRNNNGYACFAQDNDERIETQLSGAITTFRKEYGCRVFNLSIGHLTRPYRGGRQLPWALVLDELARSLDVVLVVSAGNVPDPAVPAATTESQLRSRVLDQLLTDDHAVLDPASAMLALTVGSIARTDKPFKAYANPDQQTVLVGAPPYGPSPFTRTGRVAGTGAGPAKAIKPDLVAFGGNSFLVGSDRWLDNDVLMGEPSLNLNYRASGRLLKAAVGTSVAAPYVTHVCARVDRALRLLSRWREKEPSANLIRALTVHSAVVPRQAAEWVDPTGKATERRLRLLGYGMPNPARALRSTDQRVVLLAEDELEDDHYHIYELDIPAAFARLKSKRHVRITLAYDPPVRGTRKEYLVRKIYFRLIKGKTVEDIESLAGQGKDCAQPNLRPGVDWIKDSTVQSAVFDGTQPKSFNWDGEDDSFTRWHIVVRSEPRLDSESFPPQRYAVVVSLEHSDQAVKLYTRVRNRVTLRVTQNWG